MKKHKYRPYRILPVQELTEINKQQRLQFCREMMAHIDGDFFNKILWTDESTFSTAGVYNRKNKHYWASRNPHKIAPIKFSGRTSIHVWCGVLRNRIIGPIFYRGNLTAALYHGFLENEIEQLLQNIPLHEYANIVWQQDGATPHSTVMVRNYLNTNYPVWIGKNGPISWPPNSPDLTLMDTFLWGYLKNKIYSIRNNNIHQLQNEIIEEINTLNREKQEFIVSAIENLKKRYRLCIEHNGGHFEQFL